ncbi:glycosyltransferase family 4 protein [Actinomycetospora endophytica]|uniref:Glycosyltransferase family 4 protein n=1 Tax=Actinomycetospora endophytica TaxID=2291215 RepID=A0ABS8P6S8_9PSEU|nr:glycosyltransferase family 1 protein [Actinomycetospora endophytica]MCD2193642.1 glycosyltransferase family 4 protein [Actinomycetospora endophytica]
MIYVDDRRTGNHGIARFAREVLSRLPARVSGPVRRLPVHGSASTPLDCLRPGRLRATSRDLVVSPGPNAGLSRAPQLVTLHDLIHLDTGSRLKREYYERVLRPAIARAGRVLTVSDASREAIESWLGPAAARVRVDVVGNGCSSAFTRDGEVERFTRPTLALVSNAKVHKNVEVVFRALARCPELGMVVVGPAPATMAGFAASAGVTDRVEIRHDVPDIQLARLYRGSAALVMPSTLEGFGLPVLEAMSCGTRAVYWEGCAPVAEIAAGSGVAVTGSTDDREWAEAMDKAVRGEPLHLPGTWAGRYDWDRVGDRFARAVRKLA